MKLQSKHLDLVRTEFCRAYVEAMSERDREAFIFNIIYHNHALDNHEELERAITQRFSKEFYEELKQSIIADEVI